MDRLEEIELILLGTTVPMPLTRAQCHWLVDENKRLRTEREEFRGRLADAVDFCMEKDEEIKRLRTSIRNEHFSNNGSSVYMQGPPQHGQSIMRCKHPLCLSLKQHQPIEPILQWAIEQTAKGRKLVALIPPNDSGPRYAGYYCEDGPDPPGWS